MEMTIFTVSSPMKDAPMSSVDPSKVPSEPVSSPPTESSPSNAKCDPTHYILTDSWAGRSRTPCILLSKGPKYACVRLLGTLRVGRKAFASGTEKTRVPLRSMVSTKE